MREGDEEDGEIFWTGLRDWEDLQDGEEDEEEDEEGYIGGGVLREGGRMEEDYFGGGDLRVWVRKVSRVGRRSWEEGPCQG